MRWDRRGKEEGGAGTQEAQTHEEARHWLAGKVAPSGTLLSYLVTSGAEVGWTCFMMVWIQFRRIPDVIAERVNSPSFVYTEDKLSSGTVTSPPPKDIL